MLKFQDSMSIRRPLLMVLDEDSQSLVAAGVGLQPGIAAAPRIGMQPLREVIGALLLALNALSVVCLFAFHGVSADVAAIIYVAPRR